MQDDQQPADPYEVEEELGDSDSDPAWTPAAKPGEDEEKRKKRGRAVVPKRKRPGGGGDELGGEHPLGPGPKRAGRKRRSQFDANARSNAIKLSCKIDEKLLASVSDEDIDISPFKVGLACCPDPVIRRGAFSYVIAHLSSAR